MLKLRILYKSFCSCGIHYIYPTSAKHTLTFSEWIFDDQWILLESKFLGIIYFIWVNLLVIVLLVQSQKYSPFLPSWRTNKDYSVSVYYIYRTWMDLRIESDDVAHIDSCVKAWLLGGLAPNILYSRFWLHTWILRYFRLFSSHFKSSTNIGDSVLYHTLRRLLPYLPCDPALKSLLNEFYNS